MEFYKALEKNTRIFPLLYPHFISDFKLIRASVSLFVYREYCNSKQIEDGEKQNMNKNDQRGFSLEYPMDQ